MSHRKGRWVFSAVLCVLLAASSASAQLDANLSSLLEENAEGYLSPFPTALSATLNSGIFKSGDVPFVGFNLTVDIKAVVISFSDDDKVYTTTNVPGFGTTEAPTVIGSTEGAVNTNGPGGAAIAYPGGFDLDKFGIAVPQVTIGSVLGTRAMIRYISLDLGDSDLGDLSLFGIGGQHSLSRYFPGLPVSVAAGLMYQKFKIGDVLECSALALNVTGSKKYGMVVSFEPYVGLGIDSFKMDAEYENESLSEDIKVDFDRQTDLHFTLGAGINLPVVKIHGEYNVAAANGFAVGLSFGI